MQKKNFLKRQKNRKIKHEKTLSAIYGFVIICFGLWFLRGAPDIFMYIVGGFFVMLGLNTEYGVYKRFIAEKEEKNKKK